jgi:hypothetical protein
MSPPESDLSFFRTNISGLAVAFGSDRAPCNWRKDRPVPRGDRLSAMRSRISLNGLVLRPKR